LVVYFARQVFAFLLQLGEKPALGSPQGKLALPKASI
jgi:hypothetical protein